jgi:hypothetical protein
MLDELHDNLERFAFSKLCQKQDWWSLVLSRAGLGYIGIFIFRVIGLNAIALGNIKSSYEYQFTRYHFVRLFDIVLCQIQDVLMLH